MNHIERVSNKITDKFPSWIHNNKVMALPETDVYHNGIPSEDQRATDRKALP
jgi:hypothetical protein